MSRIADLQRELQDASAALVHAERTVAAHPDISSAAATLRTIQRRKENLEQQFFEAAHELGLDVCGYRIELSNGRASIASVTAVLGIFQKIFTSVYDALLHGPKLTAKASAHTIAATELDFAYTYPGSLGVMMTIPNDRLLEGQSKLDQAMGKTFELIDAKKADKVQSLTDTLGVPALRFAHEWALANTSAGFGADITWRRDREVLREIRLQPQEIALLAFSIKSTIAKEEVVYTGDLLDVDLIERKFRMRVAGKIIHGTFTDAIGAAHPALLPRVYQATMNILQKVIVGEDQEEITYFLLRLDEPRNLSSPSLFEPR